MANLFRTVAQQQPDIYLDTTGYATGCARLCNRMCVMVQPIGYATGFPARCVQRIAIPLAHLIALREGGRAFFIKKPNQNEEAPPSSNAIK